MLFGPFFSAARRHEDAVLSSLHVSPFHLLPEFSPGTPPPPQGTHHTHERVSSTPRQIAYSILPDFILPLLFTAVRLTSTGSIQGLHNEYAYQAMATRNTIVPAHLYPLPANRNSPSHPSYPAPEHKREFTIPSGLNNVVG